jgi:hypothetical protein
MKTSTWLLASRSADALLGEVDDSSRSRVAWQARATGDRRASPAANGRLERRKAARRLQDDAT